MLNKIFALSILLISSFNLQAQLREPVERPIFSKGDNWTYRNIDDWTGKETGQSFLEFVASEGNYLVFRNTNKNTNATTTLRDDLDLGACRTLKDAEAPVCGGSYKFPMAVGHKTGYTKLPWPNGAGYDDAKCDVAASEKITVPAGTFDTLRLECDGFSTRRFDGTGTSSFKFTIWYSPLVKRFAKIVGENRVNNQIQDKSSRELVSFQVK